MPPGATKRNVLAACVFIDLFAVSLVVPQLPIRYRELGVSPVVIGLLGSVYSATQIIGGLVRFHFLLCEGSLGATSMETDTKIK